MNEQAPPPAPSPRPAGLLAAYAEHRYAILFYSLLLTLVSAPLLAAFELEGDGLRLLVAANLVASVMGLKPGRSRSVLLLATAAALGSQLVPSALVSHQLSGTGLVFWSIIALMSAAAAVRFVMRAAVVRGEHVYAAISVYMLAGIFFGLLHWTIEQGWPGAYTVASGQAGPMRMFDAVYFSFVTLTTVGYGDVMPVSDVARGLSIVEAVSGQLYLAVMIARLVGSYLQDRPHR